MLAPQGSQGLLDCIQRCPDTVVYDGQCQRKPNKWAPDSTKEEAAKVRCHQYEVNEFSGGKTFLLVIGLIGGTALLGNALNSSSNR
jgi:hypothetical protein